MESSSWYSQLVKPSWAPPDWVFGPVWSILYLMIAASFGAVFFRVLEGKLPWIVAIPFALNLFFNFAFTPLQFGLRNNAWAAIDIVLILITLGWGMAVIYPHIRWVFYALIPYFLWVSFATVLQISITYLNK